MISCQRHLCFSFELHHSFKPRYQIPKATHHKEHLSFSSRRGNLVELSHTTTTQYGAEPVMLQLAVGGRRRSLSLLLCLAVAVAVFPRAADAWKNYTVGEDKGWYDGMDLPGIDYQEWADGKNFSLGDFLIFNTDKNHSVVQTRNATLFKSCDYYDSGLDDTVEWSAAAPEFSKDAVTVAVPLLKEGRTYFFSGNYDGEQCQNGQRFASDVAHGQGLPPDLRPPAAPAPGPAAPDGVASFNFDHPKNVTTPNAADVDDDGGETSGGRRASSGSSRTVVSSRLGTGLAAVTLLVAAFFAA